MKYESNLIAYLILVTGWVLYFFFHSLFAGSAMKNRFKKSAGLYRYYRIIYSFFATAGLFILLAFNGYIDSPVLIHKSPLTNYFSLMIAATGTIIISRTFKSYSFREFIGFSLETSGELRTDGLLKYVRHPIYSGTILIVIGFWFFNPTGASLITVLSIFCYLPIGIWLEEKKLIKEFGDKYLEYKKVVPSIIPGLKRKT